MLRLPLGEVVALLLRRRRCLPQGGAQPTLLLRTALRPPRGSLQLLLPLPAPLMLVALDGGERLLLPLPKRRRLPPRVAQLSARDAVGLDEGKKMP